MILHSKGIITIVSAFLFAAGILPPRPAASGTETSKLYKGQPLEYVVRAFAYICCFEVVISLCCNATLLLLDHRHLLTGNIHLFICPSLSANLPPTSSLGAFTPRFAIGTILIVAGSLFRLWSYHALGALFTFEILIRDDHRLITSGPYAYVRHPSYTAIALLLLGVQLAQFGSGSYISACVDGSNAMWLVRSWQAASIFVVASLYRRCGVEDAALHKRFGAAWIQYSKAVPYILLPYIL